MRSINYHLLLMLISAGIGGMLYGYDVGVISGALVFIEKTIVLTPHQIGLIVGAVLSGSLVGALLSGYLADYFGRRYVIMAACLIFIIGIFQILVSHSFMQLFIARLLLGIAVGMISVVIPLYLAESAPAKIRGRSVTLFQLFLTFGILLAYGVDYYYTTTGNWHMMFAVILLPAIFLLFAITFLPETPRWLYKHGKLEKAKSVLQKTHHSHEVSAALHYLSSSPSRKLHIRDLIHHPKLLSAFMLALFIAIINQLTGINCLLQYTPLILRSSGFRSDQLTMLGTVGFGAMNLLITLIGMVLIDSIGRKKLLLFGTSLLIIANISFALLLHSPLTMLLGPAHTRFAFLALLLYIIGFAIGPGIVIWLVISETLPTAIRGSAMAWCLFANSLSAAILSTIFIDLVQALGMANIFWLFAAFTTLYTVVVWIALPETAGKTLEQIQIQ